MPHILRLLALSLIGAGFGLSACTGQVDVPPSKPGEPQKGKVAFTRFPDLPIPVGAEIDLEHTLVFGAEDSWFGRLVLKTSEGANAIFDFYKRNLGAYGWREVTSVRAAVSVLTYSRQDRVATLQIQGRTLRGSQVTITMSPRGARPAGAKPAGAK